MIKRLTNLALDFNAGNGNVTNSVNRESINLTALVDNVMQNDTSHLEEFDFGIFLRSYQMTSERTILETCSII